ncbi:hypothetical protein, variant [Sphaeroforma arctica JP610]|nr:hypothetical protein, variant [Sphaeroforma arctica JP610]KNC83590.1 hypothetical protein, variant [Sphaeroforma arctica JP610]|eukprot:XP_014157492.1 hypothetical protein, variant [Sphaeroforma arctica JP610]
MLHELVHNVHGPHDVRFYALLDVIRKECEDWMHKGFTGLKGFDTGGKKLGGNRWTNPSDAERHRVMELAATKRRRDTPYFDGRRLGGGSTLGSNKSPRELAVLAAEKRRRDNLWCGDENTIDLDDVDSAQAVPATSNGQPTVSESVSKRAKKPLASTLFAAGIGRSRGASVGRTEVANCDGPYRYGKGSSSIKNGRVSSTSKASNSTDVRLRVSVSVGQGKGKETAKGASCPEIIEILDSDDDVEGSINDVGKDTGNLQLHMAGHNGVANQSQRGAARTAKTTGTSQSPVAKQSVDTCPTQRRTVRVERDGSVWKAATGSTLSGRSDRQTNEQRYTQTVTRANASECSSPGRSKAREVGATWKCVFCTFANQRTGNTRSSPGVCTRCCMKDTVAPSLFLPDESSHSTDEERRIAIGQQVERREVPINKWACNHCTFSNTDLCSDRGAARVHTAAGVNAMMFSAPTTAEQ